jgi:hypothetical protein
MIACNVICILCKNVQKFSHYVTTTKITPKSPKFSKTSISSKIKNILDPETTPSTPSK